MRRQADGRRGVALRGLGQDLALWNLGQLPDDLGAQMIVGQNPDALRRDHRAQPIDGLLDQRPLAEESQHLLGVARRLRGQKRVPRPPARIRP